MIRSARPLASALAASLLLSVSVTPAPGGTAQSLVINEVGHTGQDFMEIHNPTGTAVDLEGYDLIIDPPRQQVVLTGTLPAGGYRTICLNHTGCDQDYAGQQLPDGPSGLALRSPDGTVIDALSWGDGGVAPYTQAEGGSTSGLIDPGDPPGNSLSRCPDGTDTDDNTQDFSLQARSKGQANPCTGPITDDPGEEPPTEEPSQEPQDVRVATIPTGDATTTSVAFSQLVYPDGPDGSAASGPTEVLLSSDASFADALASGSLQPARPLLLNDRDVLESAVLAEIRRLGAGTVRVLGGTAVISQGVVASLEAEGLAVARIAGPTRLETAEEAARYTASATEVILARAFPSDGGEDTQAFADSLAAGGWAAATARPILLTQTEMLSATTESYLSGSGVGAAEVVGGPTAISQTVIDRLEALHVASTRTAGPTRFGTAVAIATARGFTNTDPATTVILVEGQAADAWQAGFIAANAANVFAAPVVLANGEGLPPETQEFLDDAVVSVAGERPTLICAASPAACDAARAALGG